MLMDGATVSLYHSYQQKESAVVFRGRRASIEVGGGWIASMRLKTLH
jgi:hypothetical protein